MLQMLILGGGIHGTHLARRLLHHTSLTHDDIRILDPHDELLHEWRRCTRNCGMRYLRSPSVHHIDIDPFSLVKYAALAENRQDANFIPPKNRPSVGLFDRHCRMVIDGHRLASLHMKGRAVEIQNRVGHVSVLTAEETIQARFVLLALGMGEKPFWPPWAVHLKERGVIISHVFDPGFCLNDLQSDGPIAVIGAGISGGQLALHLAEKGFDGVLLISTKAIHVSDFDFDPGWLGPKYLDRFHRQSNDQRRQQIKAARAKGSVPRDMKLALDKATAMNQLTCIVDDITDAKCQDGGTLLIGRHGRYECQKIILATGFTENRPESSSLNSLAIVFISIVLEAIPFMLVGSLVGGFIEAFVSRERNGQCPTPKRLVDGVYCSRSRACFSGL